MTVPNSQYTILMPSHVLKYINKKKNFNYTCEEMREITVVLSVSFGKILTSIVRLVGENRMIRQQQELIQPQSFIRH